MSIDNFITVVNVSNVNEKIIAYRGEDIVWICDSAVIDVIDESECEGQSGLGTYICLGSGRAAVASHTLTLQGLSPVSSSSFLASRFSLEDPDPG